MILSRYIAMRYLRSFGIVTLGFTAILFFVDLVEQMRRFADAGISVFHAAVLSLLCRRVYTVDRHRRLVTEAEALFRSLNLSNITARAADGSRGLPDQAPFDRILVTAAAEDPPGPLLSQLKIGGIMVVPVGQSDAVQTLIKVTRRDDGFDYDELRQVRFVPLVEGLGQT